MDFDIDAALDQLERTLNQSDHEEKETKQTIQTSPTTSTTRKSNEELLLLDLDPLGNTENHHNNENNGENDDNLERLKQDFQDLYTTSVICDLPPVATPTLPDIIGQQDEISSTSLPLVVEQLELEVRQEILQHTLDQYSSPILLPDLTTLPNSHHENRNEINELSTSPEEEQNVSFEPIIETADTSNNIIVQNEPDLIPHETSATQRPNVLHSVDSIVNASALFDLKDHTAPNPPVADLDSIQSSSEMVFTVANDVDEESIQSPSEEPIATSPIPSPPPPAMNTSDASTQDFDLVKNILSEIFDKPDEEILDENLTEEKESELINVEQQEIPTSASSPPLSQSQAPTTTNDDEDFRFLEEMLASVDVSDTDIHQLSSAEMDRVDSLLKQIVTAQETESTPPSSTTEEIESSAVPLPPPYAAATAERPSTPLIESSTSSEATSVTSAAAASSIPIDEELVRVEQEWAKLTEEQKRLGSVAPTWIGDDLAPICMKCSSKFSITRRRHHCRACGKVFCSACCWQKVKLIHDDNKEDRACIDCVKTINDVEYLWNYMRNNQKPRTSVLRKRSGKILYFYS